MRDFEMAGEFDAVAKKVKEIVEREKQAENPSPTLTAAVQLAYLAQGLIALSDQFSHFGGIRPKGSLSQMVDAQSRGMGKFGNVDWYERIYHECDGICNRCPGCGQLNNYSPYYGHYCETQSCRAFHVEANKNLK